MRSTRIHKSAAVAAALLLGTAVALAGARAEDNDTDTGSETETQLARSEAKLEAMVRHRRATMKRIGDHMRAVIAFVRGGPGSFDDIEVYASEIKAIADQMPEMFPEGTGMTDPLGIETGAKQEIWTHWSDFAKQAALLSSEAAKLKDIAALGDKSELRQQFMSLGRNGCSGCHETFREKI